MKPLPEKLLGEMFVWAFRSISGKTGDCEPNSPWKVEVSWRPLEGYVTVAPLGGE